MNITPTYYKFLSSADLSVLPRLLGNISGTYVVHSLKISCQLAEPLDLPKQFAKSQFRTCEPFKPPNARFFYPYGTVQNFRTRLSFVRYCRRICDTLPWVFWD